MSAPLAARYGSPRSAQRPMGFTFGKFIRGAAFAWLAFNLLLPLVIVGAWAAAAAASGSPDNINFVPGALLIVPVYAAPISLAILIVIGGPLAYILGRALRGEARRGIHVAAFAGLGALIGMLVSLILPLWTWSAITTYPAQTLGEMLLGWLPNGLMFAIVTAASVIIGWWITAAFALHTERSLSSNRSLS